MNAVPATTVTLRLNPNESKQMVVPQRESENQTQAPQQNNRETEGEKSFVCVMRQRVRDQVKTSTIRAH